MFIEIVVFLELQVGDKMKEKLAGTGHCYNFENVIDIRFAPFAPSYRRVFHQAELN